MLCGPEVLDTRACRVDRKATIGEDVVWTVSFGIDVSTWIFTAGVIVVPDTPGLIVIDTSDAVNGNITLTIPAATTEDEPLGPGSWPYWLKAAIDGADPITVFGGTLSLYQPWQFVDCANDCDVFVSTEGIVDAEVSVCLPGGALDSITMRSPDGSLWSLSVTDAGVVQAVAV